MKFVLALILTGAALAGVGFANDKKAKELPPQALLKFVVVRDYNGKPIRNAGVVMHPVKSNGKQERGGLELKTDAEGKASFDGIPYGKLRVQVLVPGFQTYGGDYDVNQPTMEITIKLKRPEGQYSIYDEHAGDKKDENSPPAPKQ